MQLYVFMLHAGLDVLKEGGNAVDAAVSTALCEGIYNSMASGVGGGGFITIRSANGSVEIIDAREVAPGGASEGMFKGAILELATPQTLQLCKHRAYP